MARFWTAVVCVIVTIQCNGSETMADKDSTEDRCAVPKLPHSQLVDGNASVSIGSVISVRCNDGYRLPYSKAVFWHLVCLQGCEWADLMGNTAFHVCQRVGECPLPKFAHGSVVARPDGYMPQQMARFTCHDGFMLPDGQTTTYVVCQQDGTWTHAECVVKHCQMPIVPPHGNVGDLRTVLRGVGYLPDGLRIRYWCDPAFRLSPESAEFSSCVNGRWTGVTPRCVEVNSLQACPPPEPVRHGNTHVIASGKVRYVCHPGYSLIGAVERSCVAGQWSGDVPICVDPYDDCVPPCVTPTGRCTPPPSLLHADYNTLGGSSVHNYDGSVEDGTSIYYFCHNGYRMNSNVSTLVCKNKVWQGNLPQCVKRTTCDAPMDIENGNWVILSQFPNFNIGAKIMYECDENYKLIGASTIRCLSTGYWSDYTPQCKPQDLYCSEPGPVANGYYMCKPSHCNLFKLGTELHYVCNDHYEARASDMLVQQCVNGGFWTGDKPICLPAHRHALSSRLQLNTGTMTIVVATSCSILGLLLIVMLVVALQRRIKLSATRHVVSAPPPVPPPPPYCPLAPDSTSEHDRVALIAFADGANATLPTYEEAVRGRAPIPGRRAMPPTFGRDQHRASVVTASSARDNLSLPPYGSIDTMNVSDGTSTSVTIDTYDSAASNPSLAVSQRAAAGSIASSNESLANEDAPLLEPQHSQAETSSWSNNSSQDTVSTTASDLKDA